MRNHVGRLVIAIALLCATSVVGWSAVADSGAVYLFSYFRGERDGLHLAWSEDGLKWNALNGNKSILAPAVGKDRLMRDPSICRGPDGTFHLVWTSSWKDRIIGYASSKDLVHWSEQRAIPVMEHEPTARNCWAPEVTYNPDDGLFYIYWATTIPGRHAPIEGMDKKEDGLNHRIYVTTTKDWKTFSPTRLWLDPGFSAIDAAIVRVENGPKKWLMVVKNENHTPVEKNIRTLWTDDLSSSLPKEVSAAITPSWVEGPSALVVGGSIYVYFDRYRAGRYGAVRSDDFGKAWKDVSAETRFPEGIRHGTAFVVDKSVLDSAMRALDSRNAERRVTITLGDPAKGHEISKKLWGVFFEDINWAADGGLNPEMLANGGFDWLQADHQNNPRDDRAWNSVEDGWEHDFRDGGMARISFQCAEPVHPNTAKHLRIEAFGKGRAGVRNRGLDGMWLVDGEPYRLSFDVREIKKDGIDYSYGKWTRIVKDLVAPCFGVVASGEGWEVLLERDNDRATLSLLVSGRRAIEFDNVSLQPTGPNLVRAGLRKDLVDRLAAMKPSFVRFPGGCIVEEGDFQHWYDWRRTVGPKERRECIQNRWARPGRPYWETFGVGYYEYFRLCEEIGAEPLPICLAGLTCQYQMPPQMCAVEDADYFAGVILELIEFANGDASTTWGKVRAEMGHPKPFNLKMVGIGNENWMAEFFDRVEPIAKIVRAKHPEIEIVGSSGPGPDGREFDYAWNRVTKESADLVDEHYYRDPNWFLSQSHRYDGYDRARPAVYAGEYACHHRVGNAKPNTLWSAVCEAAAMTGFERNGDIVKMASYAPLFARLGHDQWSPNLIWFDGRASWATPNYHNQCLFSLNRPDRTIPATDNIAAGAKDFFYCAGKTDGGETIVKLVNAGEAPFRVAINLKGRAHVTMLSGERNDVNTRESPDAVKPVDTTVDLNGEITVPACSVTVVRVR